MISRLYEEKYFLPMTQVEEDNYAPWIIQGGWIWTRKRIGIRTAWEEKLQGKSREARQRLVAALPVGASAKEKTETRVQYAKGRPVQIGCRGPWSCI